MSSQCIRVWVKVEGGTGGRATSISTQPGDIIDDVIDRALARHRVNIPPQYASVRYDGKDVQRDAEAGSYETTYEKPLIIVIDEAATIRLKKSRQESKDSPEGTAFMKALLSTPTMGGGGDIMRFSVPPPWAYTPYKSLYIRKAYTDLHDIIWSKKRNAVVVGSPGTGKSFFAVYELYRALQVGKTVVFQSVPALRTFLFRPGAAVEEFPYPTAPSVSKTGQTLLLYDAGTRSGQQYSNTCDKIIIFSSPCESSYRDLQKAGAPTFCMPTWSWEELEYCARSLDNYSSLDITLVRERFETYGGIPRFVLEVDEDVAQEHFAELECALLKCDIGMLQDVVSAEGKDELSHIVFHRTLAKNYYDGSPNYHGYTCEFASKYVEKEAYKAMQQGNDSRLIMEFLRSSRHQGREDPQISTSC